MDLMTERRHLLIAKKNKYGYTLRGTSNAYTSVTQNENGDLVVSVKKTESPQTPLDYKNGYFAINTPELEFNKNYIMTAVTQVTDNPLNTLEVGVAPVGVNANRSDGIIKNGIMRIKFRFTKKSGTNDKYLEIRCAGKSMIMKNMQIWRN